MVGVLLAIVGSQFLFPDSGSSDDASSSGLSTSTLPLRDLADPAQFFEAWERSWTGEYALEGTIERVRPNERLVLDVRQARRDDRSLDQIGTTAVVVANGQQQTCEVARNGDVGCGGASEAKTPRGERDEIERVVSEDYLVYEDGPGCFFLVASDAAGLGHRFGQETLFCFDSATGAVASYRQRTGQREEIFIAVSIAATVTERDLTPR